MSEPDCPYCEIAMQERMVPAYAGHFRLHVCPRCHSELKQPLSVSPANTPPKNATSSEGHLDCPECAFGDVHCTECDDTLCPQHVRTVEKYASYLSDDLAKDLIDQYGGRLFCPLCFQNMIKRFAAAPPAPPPKPRLFNWPLILGLCSIFLIIIIGLKRCDNATDLLNPPTPTVMHHDSDAGTKP